MTQCKICKKAIEECNCTRFSDKLSLEEKVSLDSLDLKKSKLKQADEKLKYLEDEYSKEQDVEVSYEKRKKSNTTSV